MLKIPTPYSAARPKRRHQQRSLLIYGLLSTFVLVIIYLYQPEPVATTIVRSTDAVSCFFRPADAKQKIVVVSIDDESLDEYGQWPWPRSLLAELLIKIKAGGAAVVGLDILMSEPGRFSLVHDETKTPEQKGDDLLASVLSEGPFVLGYTFLFDQKSGLKQDYRLHPIYPVWIGQKGEATLYDSFYQAEDVVSNLDPLMRAVESSGFFNGTPDSDGVLRRVPLVIGYQDKLYPSFALSIVNKLESPEKLVLSRDKSHVITLTSGSLVIPTDNKGNVLPGNLGHTDYEIISAGNILGGDFPPNLFDDTVVLVGITAAGLTHKYVTPGSSATSSVVLHGNTIESILSGKLIVRTPDFITFEALAAIAAFLMLLLAAMYLPGIWIIGLGISAVMACWGGCVWMFQESGYLFSPILPSVTLILNIFLLITIKYKHSQNEAQAETDNALSRLEMSRQDLKSILNAVPDIIYRLDTEGRITFVSPAVEKYGRKVETLIGKSVFDLVASTDINKAKHRLNERRTGERATSGLELSLRLSGGMEGKSQKRFFSVSAEGIYSKDNNSGALFEGSQGIIRDITKQKQLEGQLLKAQRQEVIGKLASRVAHDLNNILTGLVSYPDLLLHELDPDDPMYKKISIIQKSGKRAANIVQDLITLAGRSSRVRSICNMAVLIDQCTKSAEMQQLLQDNPQIRFHTNVPENLMKVKGIEVQLSKAIMSVIRNGVGAMLNRDDGELTISAQDMYLDTEIVAYETIPEGEYVCITIADTGVGLERDKLYHIFESFTTSAHKGDRRTGLGLAILRAIVKDHSGYLDIESVPGEGTKVSIYLPATREKGPDREQAPQPIDSSGSETVLVVDDSIDQLEIARGALNRLGYTALTAVSGEQALTVLEKHSVQLVLMDMVMPGGLGGLETYREIMHRFPGQKAIMTSGYFEPDAQDELRALGIETFLEKPYSVAGLGSSVRRELDRDTVN